MINKTNKWQMWENGAVFDHRCLPQFVGTDLRDFGQVLRIEKDSGGQKHPFYYGGWWFFAFPVAAVKYHPFPFFVRGDDVSFSIANPFNIHTLNGVVSFQDHFIDKESPLVWYLDLRSHMAHHLSLPDMQSSAFKVARIAWWFFLRNLAKFQYETIEAILLAWQDVMQGPEFFAANADMAVRRKTIAAFCQREKFSPVVIGTLGERRRYFPRSRLMRAVFMLSLNGHFLPFYRLWANKVIIYAPDRRNFHHVWGSGELTFVNGSRDQAFTVHHSKRIGLTQLGRMVWLSLKFILKYPGLLESYQKRYPELTSTQYWQTTMPLETQENEMKNDR